MRIIFIKHTMGGVIDTVDPNTCDMHSHRLIVHRKDYWQTVLLMSEFARRLIAICYRN